MQNAHDAKIKTWQNIYGNTKPMPEYQEIVNIIWQRIDSAIKNREFHTFYNKMTLEQLMYIMEYFAGWGYKNDGGQSFSTGWQVHLFWK